MSHSAANETASPGWPLHVKVLVGFLAGAVLGLFGHFQAPDSAWLQGLITYLANPVGQVFLGLLFMLVLPLMSTALILGVSELGDIASLGRLGWRTLIYTGAVTGMAVAIGLVMVNLMRPGVGMDPAMLQAAMASSAIKAKEISQAGASLNAMDLILGIVPHNIVAAAVDDKQKLSVVFFALMIGVGLVLTPSPATQRFKEAVQGLFEICMRLIGLIIRMAPYAVACLMFKLCATLGWDAVVKLLWFSLTVLLALGLHMFVVLPLWVRVMSGMSPLAFFRNSEEAMLTAFATASSSATLPVTLRVAEENLKLPRKVARFVLTVGASANHHGTALFEGVTVLFLAQAFNIPLDLTQQLMVLGLCILGGIGTAGVPSGSLPVIAMICGIIGVPVEGIGIIIGVNQFLDMCRTAVNVTGDLATAVVVSHNSEELVAAT